VQDILELIAMERIIAGAISVYFLRDNREFLSLVIS
jgi:hypothetical protein